MIKAISLIGFKSFLHRELNLNMLTVLTGLNSSGKSSVIQALLMCEKAAYNENSVLLEGHGTVEEIRNKYFNDDIEVHVAIENQKTFSISIPPTNATRHYYFKGERGYFPDLIYISAHRFGPKTLIPIFNGKIDGIGPNGENVLQCIEIYSDRILDSRLRHENSEGDTVLFNIRGWLSVIAPNVEFRHYLNRVIDSSYSTFDEHRATNVGFGLSYILPVITALLIGTLNKDCLVIIENPEAHLHPRGQTEIARLISLCVEVGAQVIVETHSDHLFDGIRIAARKISGFADKVQVHWFELDKQKNTEVYSPTLYSDGRLDEWPKGLFDQFEINASDLM